MRETKRVIRSTDALDGVSDHLGEVLRRADELLADWSRFGAQVRTQVDREAQQLGAAVARAVDDAVTRATSAGVDRAIADQIGAKLAALSTEIVKLESRTRAASRAIADERRGDRRVLWAVAAGVLAANGLLLALLLRPAPVPPAVIQPEPTRVEPAVVPDAAVVEPPATTGEAPIEFPTDKPPEPVKAKPDDKPVQANPDEPAKATHAKHEPAKAAHAKDEPKARPRVKQGPPGKLMAVPPKR